MLIMEVTKSNLTGTQIMQILRDAKVRPSVHRMAVLEYVSNRRTHPTAEEVFGALSVDFPTVSRTTVYNSLHTLVDAGVLRELDIEGTSTRYDLALQVPHSHFRCTGCGTIYDMALPEGIDRMVTPGFKVDATDLFFAGVCPECLAKTKKEY